MRVSKRIASLLANRQEQAKRCATIAHRIEAEDPTVCRFMAERGAEYYYGQRDACHAVIEMVLQDHAAYSGFWIKRCPNTGAEWHIYDLKKALPA